jgi:hypothetical protein
MQKMRTSLIVLAATLMVGGAQAQDNPLVGDWLSTHMDPSGRTNYAVYIRFQADGQAINRNLVSGSGGSADFTIIWQYHLTGPNAYTARVVDWEPKQVCGAGMCLPNTPAIPVGTVQDCTFEIQNGAIMDLNCGGTPTRFTRQG